MQSLFTLCNCSLVFLFSLKVSNQFFINWRHLPFSEFLDNPSQTSFSPSRVVVDRCVGSCVGQIVVGLAVVVVPVVVDVWNCVLSCVACADGRSVVVRVGEGHVGRGIWGEKFQPQDLIFTQFLSLSPKRHFEGTSHHSQCHRHLPLHLHNTVHLIYLIFTDTLWFLGTFWSSFESLCLFQLKKNPTCQLGIVFGRPPVCDKISDSSAKTWTIFQIDRQSNQSYRSDLLCKYELQNKADHQGRQGRCKEEPRQAQVWVGEFGTDDLDELAGQRIAFLMPWTRICSTNRRLPPLFQEVSSSFSCLAKYWNDWEWNRLLSWTPASPPLLVLAGLASCPISR